MCPLKAVVDLSFCECSVLGSCKKKVSFSIFIFVEFVSGLAFVGQYILRLQGRTSISSEQGDVNLPLILFSYHPFYFGFVIFVDFFFLVLGLSVFSVTP